MTSTRNTLFAALLAAICLSAANLAQAQGFGFARADGNGDGAISAAEAQEARGRMFDRIDRNNDAMISPAELQRVRDRLAAFARLADSAVVLRAEGLDADGDGNLSQAEFMAKNTMFEMADRNSDGVVSQDEIAALRARMGQQ